VTADSAARLKELVGRLEAEPTLVAEREAGDALAEEVGGELALGWRIAVVRAVMVAPPDGDVVREAYGELVDRYRDDQAALASIRPLGDEIRRRESDGSLASVLVARSDRRPKTNNG
jgi:hypothetical protein